MATVEELQLFIQERLRAFDSEIRLETGSPADVQVIQPLIRRFSPDALETDLELFIKDRLLQEFPNMYVGEGSGLADTLVKPMRVLLEPFVREIRAVRRNQSLLDPAILNRDEADALVKNIWISRNPGEYARVKVRAYFANPVSVNIGGSNVAYTATSRRYLPVTSQSLTSEGMLFNQDGSLYYMDIDFVAEGRGEAYNVGPGEIIGITNIPSAVKITNLRDATLGNNEETTLALVSRAEQSIGERSLAATPGIVRTLFEGLPTLRIIQAIGFNDEEMQRDVLSGGGLGSVVESGLDGATSDDGDGDGYTDLFNSAGSSFTTALGPVGTDLSTYVLTVWVSGVPQDFMLGSVLGANQVSISSSYTGTNRLPDSLSTATFTVRQRTMTLSGIPGGILFPDSDGETLDVAPDSVHIGGCVDFYGIGDGFSDETIALDALGDRAPSIRRPGLSTTAASREVVITSATAAEAALITPGTSTLHIVEGTDIGVYRILASSYAAGPAEITLRLAIDLTATATGLLFEVTDFIETSLIEPKETLVEGSDLNTYAGGAWVNTVGNTVWSDYGVTSSHYLEILTGDDVGTYEITSTSGFVLNIGAVLGQTDGPLSYRVVRKQEAGISRPLARVTAVELLDSSLEPTGNYIPYRHPVDVRSFTFQNPGRGAKAGSATVITNDEVSVDTVANAGKLTSSNTGINYYQLGVRPGDIVNILTGDNRGYYTVADDGVGGSPAAAIGLLDYELLITEALAWDDASMTYSTGEPSYGSFRVYFLEPVTFWVDSDTTLFSVEQAGVTRRFKPDPQVHTSYLPTDDTLVSLDLTLGSATTDVVNDETLAAIYTDVFQVAAGDRVEITYTPITGSADLSTGTFATNGGTVLFDLGSGQERVRFSDDLNVDDIISEINTQLSREIVTKWADGGAEYLQIKSDGEVTLLDNSGDTADVTAIIFGTTPATYNPWVTEPAFAGENISNDSPHKGYWFVSSVGLTSIDLEDSTGAAFSSSYTVSGQYAVFTRAGWQRISSTAMDDQRDDLGLYYFDVECVSEGYGDSWNIAAELQGTVTGYGSEGWELEVEDENLTYSMVEELVIRFSPRVLLVGLADDPDNYEELLGASFEVNYERSTVIEEMDSLVRSVQQRNICQSPLARILLPTYVRTSISYNEGLTEEDARTEIKNLIEDVLPERQLEVSDITAILTESGSTKVVMPITVIGIAHQLDRSLVVERSEDAISSTRLSALIPDDDDTSEGASWILLHRA